MKTLSYKDKEGNKQTIGMYNIESPVVSQSTGLSTKEVMSQKAITDELGKKADKNEIYTKSEIDNKLSNIDIPDIDLSQYEEVYVVEIDSDNNILTSVDKLSEIYNKAKENKNISVLLKQGLIYYKSCEKYDNTNPTISFTYLITTSTTSNFQSFTPKLLKRISLTLTYNGPDYGVVGRIRVEEFPSYATESYVDESLKNIDHTLYKVVESIPLTPDEADKNKIFLVPADDTEEQNAYVEYIYTEEGWEKLGEKVGIDLGDVEATKLKTPVKLWGQEFDGSKDVSGNITFKNPGKIDKVQQLKPWFPFSIDDDNITTVFCASSYDDNVYIGLNGGYDEEYYYNIVLNGRTKIEELIANSVYTTLGYGSLINLQGENVEIGEKLGKITLMNYTECNGTFTAWDNIYIRRNRDIYEVATKIDLKSKADDDKVIKSIHTDTDTAYPTDGWIGFFGRNGINTDIEEPYCIYIDVDTDIIATREYVDDKQNELEEWKDKLTSLKYCSGLGATDHGPNDVKLNVGTLPFDGSSSSITYYKQAIGSATTSTAGVMSATDKTNLDNITEWKNSSLQKIVLGSLNVATTEDNVGLSGSRTYLNGEVYSNWSQTLPSATTTTAGVMSASDKQALDKVVDDVETLDLSLTNAVIGEEVLDGQTFPEINTVTREELKKDLFIDMWNQACKYGSREVYGKYNEETGYFELNGITDLTYDEAINILLLAPLSRTSFINKEDWFYNLSVRTLFPIIYSNDNAQTNLYKAFQSCPNLEVVAFTSSSSVIGIQVSNANRIFSGCYKLRVVDGIFNLKNITNANNYPWLGNCSSLEELKLFNVQFSYSQLQYCPLISFNSLTYLVQNAINTSPITITVHPDVYAKLTEGDEEWQALNELALSKQIIFATV